MMKYLKVFTDFAKDMEPLSFEERGRLFTAMLRYAEDGTETGLSGNERFLWGTVRKIIDKEASSYQERCERNKKNVSARYASTSRNQSLPVVTKTYDWNEEKEKEKEKDIKKEILSNESKERRFVKPSLEEVSEYIRERGYTVDAERFVNHYTANGWRVGKAPMKDWKAAVRNWQKGEPRKQTAYRNEDLERLEVQL